MPNASISAAPNSATAGRSRRYEGIERRDRSANVRTKIPAATWVRASATGGGYDVPRLRLPWNAEVRSVSVKECLYRSADE